MALSNNGYNLTVTVVDNGGNTSTITYALSANTFADASTDSTTILTALANVTDAVVKSYSVSQRFVEDALVLPASGVQVENQAVISALIDGQADKYATIKIPAAKPAIFVGLSGRAANEVDPTDTEVQAYVNLFDGDPCTISDNESVAAASASTVKGKRVHRGSRKG